MEITNECNLNCSICMRNVWDVKYGGMSAEIFKRILSGLEGLGKKPELFFGGYGEPLSHPACLDMIEQAKTAGHPVSLISNGILLTEQVTCRLIELKLDKLWYRWMVHHQNAMRMSALETPCLLSSKI